MKARFALGITLLGAGLAAAFLQARALDDRDPPQVTTDTRPVTEIRDRPAVVSYADVLDTVRPAVVSVYSERVVRQRFPNWLDTDPMFRFFRDRLPQQEQQQRVPGVGSGFIVSADGYILTNHHVVDGADELNVQLEDGRRLPAEIIGSDPQTDVAVIKIDAENLPHAVLGDSEQLRVGDVVFALGNPLDVGQTVTMGIVSAKSRALGILNRTSGGPGYEDFIQTDAAINLGNSGGPLVDAVGRVVGINTAIVSPSRGSIGIGFAVPISLAQSIMNSLVTTGEVTRGYLGVRMQAVAPEVAEQYGVSEVRGAFVIEVLPDSPAAEAGLQREDIIIAVNGRPVRSQEDVRVAIAQIRPGSKVDLRVVRNREEITVSVTLGRLGDDVASGGQQRGSRLLDGVRVRPIAGMSEEERNSLQLSPDIADGLVVSEVEDGSPFAGRIPVGAVIISINRTRATDIETARRALQPGRRNIFIVSVEGASQMLIIPLPSGR